MSKELSTPLRKNVIYVIYVLKYFNDISKRLTAQRKVQNLFLFKNIDVFDVALVILLLTLIIFHTFSSVSIFDFKLVNVSWASQMFDKVLNSSL